MYYQIGTSEPKGVVGSRAAASKDLAEATEQCREYSMARHVKEAWLRPVENGRMGDVIVRFVKGQEVNDGVR
jgi:hypothetical protein